MKAIFILLLTVSSTLLSQNCNIGNETITGQYTTAQISGDILVGQKFSLAQESTLRSLNLIGNVAGAGVQMALYDDNAGVPNKLLISSGFETVKNGLNTFEVSTLLLSPGDYWIMAVYENTGNHTKINFAANKTKYFKTIQYGVSLPVNASDFSTFTGGDNLYFLGLDCGNTLTNKELEIKKFEIFPNPVTNSIKIKNIVNNTGFIILNQQGQVVLKGSVKNNEIKLKNLSSGLYFIKIGENSFLKFIKS